MKTANQLRKPAMALITSWDETCDVACYSYYLKQALDPFFDITVLPLSRSKFNAVDTKADLAIAEALVDDIAAQVGAFDYVNFQFEPSILGPNATVASKRFMRILRDAKSVIVAFHTIERPKRIVARQQIGPLSRLRVRAATAPIVRNLYLDASWGAVFRFLDRLARTGKRVAAVGHTMRDAQYLRNMMPNVTVGDTPLVYLSGRHIPRIEALAEHSSLKRLLPPPTPSTRYLGAFGFFSGYKGFETAVAALEFLPEEYELLMFASVDEGALGPGQKSDWYLDSLLANIRQSKTKNLRERVHFIGAQSDDDLLLGMMLCDAVVFPHTNDDNSASGPIAQALDLSRRVFASRNRQFIELAKYRPDFEFCDIGNPLEYAQKIPRLTKDRVDRDVHGMRFVDYPHIRQRHTPATSALVYLDALGIHPPSNVAGAPSAREFSLV